jgi:diadenosine tetraphosphate (Ap4A) HIT family hydrolase
MQQKEGFFKIKPQEAWTDPLDGCIVETQNAIVALNIVPASFGHVLVFPKNQHARDFNDTDNS